MVLLGHLSQVVECNCFRSLPVRIRPASTEAWWSVQEVKHRQVVEVIFLHTVKCGTFVVSVFNLSKHDYNPLLTNLQYFVPTRFPKLAIYLPSANERVRAHFAAKWWSKAFQPAGTGAFFGDFHHIRCALSCAGWEYRITVQHFHKRLYTSLISVDTETGEKEQTSLRTVLHGNEWPWNLCTATYLKSSLSTLRSRSRFASQFELNQARSTHR